MKATDDEKPNLQSDNASMPVMATRERARIETALPLEMATGELVHLHSLSTTHDQTARALPV